MRCSVAILAFVSAAPVCSQDLIGISWQGGVYAIDSYAPTSATLIGNANLGANAIELAACRLWSAQRIGSFPWTYELVEIDPVTGTSTFVRPFVDVRGMAADGASPVIWCHTEGSPDMLQLYDVLTGTFTPIGPFGRSSLQSLAFHNGVLYALDLSSGLATVDLTTGAATLVGGPGAPSDGRQFLTSRSDGKLLAGQSSLDEVDPATGVFTYIGSLGGVDFRGAVEFYGRATHSGTACNGGFGPVGHSVTGSLFGGGTLTTTSTNHDPALPGAVLFGFAPPQGLLIDPFLGTVGCTLLSNHLASVPVTSGATTPATMTLTFGLTTDVCGQLMTLQHGALFESVPGAVSFSDVASIQF